MLRLSMATIRLMRSRDRKQATLTSRISTERIEAHNCPLGGCQLYFMRSWLGGGNTMFWKVSGFNTGAFSELLAGIGLIVRAQLAWLGVEAAALAGASQPTSNFLIN